MMSVALVFVFATLTLSQAVDTACKSRSCFDYVNECGKQYGGCVDMCGDSFSWPSFTKPPCPATPAAQLGPAALVFSSAARLAPAITRTTTGCSETICIDAVNDCGVWYGGCFPICSGYPRPTPTPPPCPSSSAKPFRPLIAAVTSISLPHLYPGTDCDTIVCLDYKNDCDRKYGGCFPNCNGATTPVYTDPGCPASSIGLGGGSGLVSETVSGSQAARVTSANGAAVATLTAAPPVTTLDLRWGAK